MTIKELLEGAKTRIQTHGWAKKSTNGVTSPKCIVLTLNEVWVKAVKQEMAVIPDEFANTLENVFYRNQSVMENAKRYLLLSAREKANDETISGIIEYNDDPRTTKEMMLEVLDMAIARCDVSSTSSVTPS